MRYSIATNWDFDLLERLEGTSVQSLYGQMWNDPLGGGRMALFIPKVGKTEVASFIAEARKRGLSFNYLINATCFDNLEFTKRGYRKIADHVDWISSIGVDMVTVALPFLLEMVKREFPNLKVCVSSFARIQNIHLARYWEDLGAQKIILPESIGRDFRTLRSIREAVGCELELIANHCCLFQCPLDLHHRNMVSHGSQEGHPCGGFAPDYCKLACQRLKLFRPAELIKSRWIRPEDVSDYEVMGIDCLKLIERFRGTESLVQIMNAYERKSYKGNLVELLSLPQQGAFLAPNMEVLQRTDLIEPEKMEEAMEVLKEPFPGKVFIDNSKLNSFLDYFKKTDCFHTDCNRCGYCEQMASKAVSIDEDWRKEMISRFEKAIDILITGEIAGFGPSPLRPFPV
ncbi:MAG TPA: U32 family peptidase [Thermodesulfobacteriota bacterium]|nr:U32 family peptidase [Thermodesulfobacteriota bacterium]